MSANSSPRYRLAPPLPPKTSPDARTGSLGSSRSRAVRQPPRRVEVARAVDGSPVAVQEARRHDADVGPGVELGDERGEPAGVGDGVVVQQRDGAVAPLERHGDATVDATGKTEVGCIAHDRHRDRRDLVGEALQHGERVVGRTVVDHNDRRLRARLGGQRPDARRQPIGAVPVRDDDSDHRRPRSLARSSLGSPRHLVRSLEARSVTAPSFARSKLLGSPRHLVRSLEARSAHRATSFARSKLARLTLPTPGASHATRRRTSSSCAGGPPPARTSRAWAAPSTPAPPSACA